PIRIVVDPWPVDRVSGISGGCSIAGPGSEHLREVRRRQRPAEIVPLSLATAHRLEACELPGSFDSLRHDSMLEALPHADHGADDGGGVGRVGDLVDERLVNLQHVDWELVEITEARISRAKIIDRQ